MGHPGAETLCPAVETTPLKPKEGLNGAPRLSLRFSSSGDGLAGFFVGGATALGFALVP